jgi:hypothetical protein
VRPEVNAVMSKGALAGPAHFVLLARSVHMNVSSSPCSCAAVPFTGHVSCYS